MVRGKYHVGVCHCSGDLKSQENQISGLTYSTKKEVLPIYHFDKSNIILSIESDFLNLLAALAACIARSWNLTPA